LDEYGALEVGRLVTHVGTCAAPVTAERESRQRTWQYRFGACPHVVAPWLPSAPLGRMATRLLHVPAVYQTACDPGSRGVVWCLLRQRPDAALTAPAMAQEVKLPCKQSLLPGADW
jgi:hypothetical protein